MNISKLKRKRIDLKIWRIIETKWTKINKNWRIEILELIIDNIEIAIRREGIKNVCEIRRVNKLIKVDDWELVVEF